MNFPPILETSDEGQLSDEEYDYRVDGVVKHLGRTDLIPSKEPSQSPPEGATLVEPTRIPAFIIHEPCGSSVASSLDRNPIIPLSEPQSPASDKRSPHISKKQGNNNNNNNNHSVLIKATFQTPMISNARDSMMPSDILKDK
jgi:hypothetical protein